MNLPFESMFRPATRRPNKMLYVIAVWGLIVFFASVYKNYAGNAKEIPPVVLEAAALTAGQDANPVTVSVDATKSLPSGIENLRGIIRDSSLPASAALGTGEVSSTAKTPDWFIWGHFGTKQAGTTLLPADSPVGIYAVTSAEGPTTLLVNRSAQPLAVTFRQRLRGGIYTMERLSCVPNAAPSSGPAMTALHDAGHSPSQSAAHLVFLEGCSLSGSQVVVKSLTLQAGETALIRTTDTALKARNAYYETCRQLDILRPHVPGPAARLKQMLREGEMYVGNVSGEGRGGERRLGSIHRLLLVTAQVESLYRNYLARNTVKKENGAGVARSLAQLGDALAAASAVLLDLVPQVDILPDAHGAQVRVGLTNAGAHSVDFVKLGLDSSVLPSGVTLDQTDPAFFGVVRPGQSVEATFRLQSSHGGLALSRACVVDVSYIVAQSSAHLHLHSW